MNELDVLSKWENPSRPAITTTNPAGATDQLHESSKTDQTKNIRADLRNLQMLGESLQSKINSSPETINLCRKFNYEFYHHTYVMFLFDAT